MFELSHFHLVFIQPIPPTWRHGDLFSLMTLL